jgi:hypothetical protein
MKIITIILIFFTLLANSQEKRILDNIEITDQTKLIGIYPFYDKNKTYRELNFFVDKIDVIDSISKTLTYNDKLEKNIIEQNHFSIYLIQDYKRVDYWLISPKFESVSFYGKSYNFDIDFLLNLSKKFHFNYFVVDKIFKSQNEYGAYLIKQKQNSNFIFSYSPDFKFEGKFEIEFPKNDKFKSPKAISEYLEKEILKIVDSKVDFRAYYIINDYNTKNRNQYTMTIESSKEVFEKLKLKKLKNKNWIKNEPEGTFYYKE